MPEIRQLSQSVVNKIAAGEVIERPASVVKELVENSVDSGATRIDVVIEQGGTQLIRVSDNGCGIDEDQLSLAVSAHATSKIRGADDLFKVSTLGFRGEALASIAEISQFRIRSRTADAASGSEMEVNGGQLVEITPCGAPTGTSIEVRNLFFNTPVRQKFMKTTQTEFGHASEALTRIALAFPHVHFTLKHGNRQIHDLPPTNTWRERVASFFGDELADHLIEIESSDEAVRLSGYVADPKFSRANNRMQYLFLNGRHIRDRALQHALTEAYRGLLLTGRFPIAFLKLEMPPEMVDVNVHPTKMEVRFQESGKIYSQLLGTLRSRFLSTDLTAKYRPTELDQRALDEAGTKEDASSQQMRDELVAWAKGEVGEGATNAMSTVQQSPQSLQADLDLDFRSASHPPLKLNRIQRDTVSSEFDGWNVGKEFGENPEGQASSETGSSLPTSSDRMPNSGSTGMRALQLHNRYLIAESDDGMIVIDQHALHERILYEEIREKVLAGRLESQRLLVPDTLNLSPTEYAAVIESQELLAKLGIEIEPFGGDTVLVQSYPAMLHRKNPSEVLRGMIDQLLTEGKSPDRRDLLDELLHMMSCKAAVKAGDRLSTEEIEALLDLRELCQDSHHCPHGRPTSLVFTNEELDKRFQRT
ncbi:MAG: DNA mismatch repair protein MutL [Blastopirellula sp.]|nr:MAG: DNA mismatch repair protein MutL [Blastopirellula sp.]